MKNCSISFLLTGTFSSNSKAKGNINPKREVNTTAKKDKNSYHNAENHEKPVLGEE